jgi:hypothetical protein
MAQIMESEVGEEFGVWLAADASACCLIALSCPLDSFGKGNARGSDVGL